MTLPEAVSQTVTWGDHRLSYTITGQTEAELVVLIHPAFGDHTCFALQINDLAAHYRVVAIDLPGHGTAQPAASSTRVVDSADLIAELLAQEGYTRTHVVGVSLGALVAQDMAIRYANNVSSLTVVGGYPIFGTSPAIQRAQTFELLRLLPFMIFSLQRLRRAVAQAATFQPHARELFLQSAQGFTQRSLRSLAGSDALLRPVFQPLGVPLQIVVGEHERPLLRTAAEAWQRREPGSLLEIIPAAGHCANMDNPAVFNQRLVAFLRQQGGGESTFSARIGDPSFQS
jgi:pimeloyl-ACP methyl ester carboxylesterase